MFNVLRISIQLQIKRFRKIHPLNGNRIADGYQRLVVIAMHLKVLSAISPELFTFIIRDENYFSRQVWKVVNRAGNVLLLNELGRMLKAKLTVYELDNYYDEEDTYWKLKIGETRNPELRNDSNS